MREILLTSFICLFLIACKGKKEVSNSTNDNQEKAQTNEMNQSSETQASKVSAPTKNFLRKLNEEKAKSSESYVPSESLIKDYNLKKESEQYYIGGMIRTKEGAYEKQINDLGVIIGTRAGNIWTARIPILKLEQLTKVQDVDYVQIDESVNTK